MPVSGEKYTKEDGITYYEIKVLAMIKLDFEFFGTCRKHKTGVVKVINNMFERRLYGLLSVRKEDGWLLSTFNLTYKVGWDNICKAIYATYDCYENVEVLIDDKTIEINSKEEILKLEEAGNMTMSWMCKIINA